MVRLQRAAGNRSGLQLLHRRVTKRRVGEPGVGASTGYEAGEKAASQISPGRVEDTKDGTLLFDFAVNSNGIKQEHEAKLRQMFKDLRWDSKESLFPIKEIIGFTDAVHRQGGNVALREDRADTVQAFLQIIGTIKANQGVVRAAPEDRFVATNETRDGRARNRSVLIVTDAFLPPEPPPPTPKPETKAHTKWQIGEVASIQPPIKEGISVNVLLVRVREDVAGGRKFALAFAGVGPGLGIDLGDLKKIQKLRKIAKIILKTIASLGIDADAITGDEHPFTTREPATKSDFFGQGLVAHVDVGPGEIEQVGLPMHTTPEAIDLGGLQVGLSLGAGVETGVWIPLMDL
jgi:outer membrane protein OmpA-like peptidoglycan-associated protein